MKMKNSLNKLKTKFLESCVLSFKLYSILVRFGILSSLNYKSYLTTVTVANKTRQNIKLSPLSFISCFSTKNTVSKLGTKEVLPFIFYMQVRSFIVNLNNTKNNTVDPNDPFTLENKQETSNSYDLISTAANVKIENKIIPLFSNPIYLKEIKLKKKRNFKLNSPSLLNTNSLGLDKKEVNNLYRRTVISNTDINSLTPKPITFKEILSLFLKGFSIYNFNLNQYLLSSLPQKQSYGKKLDLIRELSNINKNLTFSSYLRSNTTTITNPVPVAPECREEDHKEKFIKNIKDNLNLESKPIINLYLKEMSKFNMIRKGLFIHYSKFIGFNFNKENNKLHKNIYKLLAASFKSMYCLISKPVFIFTADKVIIQLFYYLFIPNILKLKKFYKHNNSIPFVKYYSTLQPSVLQSYGRKATIKNSSLSSDSNQGESFLNKEENGPWYLNKEEAGITEQNRVESIVQSNHSSIETRNKNQSIYIRNKNIKKQYSKFRKVKLSVRVKLRKLSNVTLTKVFSNKFKILCLNLNKIFKKPVELDLIRLHYPYKDSNILVNLLGIMINKIKLRIIIRRLFEKAVIKNLNKFNVLNSNKTNIIPAFLSGMTIRVAGRLLTHKVVPRQTVKTIRRGATAKGKINFKDVATYTNKNKRGAFSITVKSGQNFFPV